MLFFLSLDLNFMFSALIDVASAPLSHRVSF